MKRLLATFPVLTLLVAMMTACGNTDQADQGSTGSNVVQDEGVQMNNGDHNTEAEDSEATDHSYPRTIQHVKGKLTLETKPVRIASVDVMVTDYLLVLDETPIVSEGISTKERSDIFAEYAADKDIIDLGGKVNKETIVENNPDLLIMSSESKKVESYDEYNLIADTVVIDFSQGVRSRLRQIAEIVGKEELAEQIIADFDAKVKEASTIAANYKEDTVLFLISNGKDFTVMDPRKFAVYYDEIGLVAPDGLPEEENGRIGIEALSALNPDHIFIAENRRSMNGDDRLSLIRVWQENPVWQGLKAVKNNHLYPVDTLVGDTFFLGQLAGVEAVIEHLGNH